MRPRARNGGRGRSARALAVGLWALALLPVLAAPADDRLRSLARRAGQGEPLFRVGLDSAPSLRIHAPRGYRILDPATGEPVWRSEYTGRVTVVAEGAPDEGVRSVFRVQVGAFGSREAAEAERDRLAAHLGVPSVVRHVPDRDSWRVRVGEATSRDGLATLMERLRKDGAESPWIVEEPAEASEGVTLRLVDERYESRSTGLRRLVVVPGGAGRVEVEDASYRGVVELRVSPFGTVRAINWVELEAYLQGVVPAELGPAAWPKLEALKAQAVAARTYAWRHRGQFEDEGFDLCGTPRCQVYAGASAEHPLSDRAVRRTRGQILTWEGEPITALYTATCGGHTEDAVEIFPEEAAPYLRGVPCRAETDALESLRGTIEGRPVIPLVAEDGRDVTRDWGLLVASGVLGGEPPASLLSSVRAADLRRWTKALARTVGRPVPEGPPGPAGNLGEACATLMADLGWAERARVLLDEGDPPALLRDPEAAGLPPDRRRALAYLALSGGVLPFADGSFHVGEAPSAARLLPALARVGEAYGNFGLVEATVMAVRGSALRVQRGTGEVKLPVGDTPFLFRWSGDRAVPARSLDLWPGDRIRYRTGPNGRVDFVELVPPVKGVADDRLAKVFSWEVRKTRRQLEAAVNRRVAVGRLENLEVVRRGRSGRIVELKVVGSRGSTLVRGFDVRRLLGLRESLTVIEIQRDAAGRPTAAVFAGKGWGHGVGLCQVGAYGMALRGRSYEEILSHYYTGARLERIDAGP